MTTLLDAIKLLHTFVQETAEILNNHKENANTLTVDEIKCHAKYGTTMQYVQLQLCSLVELINKNISTYNDITNEINRELTNIDNITGETGDEYVNPLELRGLPELKFVETPVAKSISQVNESVAKKQSMDFEISDKITVTFPRVATVRDIPEAICYVEDKESFFICLAKNTYVEIPIGDFLSAEKYRTIACDRTRCANRNCTFSHPGQTRFIYTNSMFGNIKTIAKDINEIMPYDIRDILYKSLVPLFPVAIWLKYAIKIQKLRSKNEVKTIKDLQIQIEQSYTLEDLFASI